MTRDAWIAKRDRLADLLGGGAFGLEKADDAMLIAVGECPGSDLKPFPVFELAGVNNKPLKVDNAPGGLVAVVAVHPPFLNDRMCFELAEALVAAGQWAAEQDA